MSRLVLLLALVGAGCAAPRPATEPAETRAVHLAGRFVTSYQGRPDEGVYGLHVWLLFRRADGAGWERARLPDGSARRHRHYDVLGEDGAFRFDLATDDLAGYDEVAVAPSTRTAAVHLVPTPRGARTLADTVTVLPLADAIRVPVPATGPVAADGLSARLGPEVGVVVRYAELAREFVVARYGGDVPFALPPVRVELSPGGGYVFQALDPDVLALGGHEIELNVARGISPTLVAHEYGHYVSFQMWGASPLRYTLRNRNLREGWAIFFSFASRAYTAARYGELDLASSNPERAPFTDTFAGPRRYLGVVYGTSRPDYAAIGSLLWSLYDVAEPSPFEYEGDDLDGLAGDNDAVAGGPAVFEAVRTTRTRLTKEAGIREVVQTLQRALPEQAEAIGGAADFFLCPAWPSCDVTAPPDASPSTGTPGLRPVSPAGLTARRLSPTSVALSWDRRVGVMPWSNPPAGYRVVRDGAEVATLPASASAWVDPEAGPGRRRYQVRAVDAGGESVGDGAEAAVGEE